MHDIRAVTFDVGSTLIEPWPSVGHVYASVAAEHGVTELSPEDLNKRFAAAWRTLNCRAESREDWEAIVRAAFQGIGPFTDPAALFETLYSRFMQPTVWQVFDDVMPTLESLQKQRIRLGIISNWDERLRPLLGALKLREFFEVLVVSCEVGFRKPDSGIFRQTAQEFDLRPGQILHVGDSLEHDLLGAHQAGLRAVGIRRSCQPTDSRWISGLEALLQRL